MGVRVEVGVEVGVTPAVFASAKRTREQSRSLSLKALKRLVCLSSVFPPSFLRLHLSPEEEGGTICPSFLCDFSLSPPALAALT